MLIEVEELFIFYYVYFQNALKLNLSQLRDHKIRVEYTLPGNKKNTNRKKVIKNKTKKILGQKKKAAKKKNVKPL